MDILNFISWIRGRRQVTSVDPAKTLIPVGLKDGRRDDEYLTGAISVEDLAAQIAPPPTIPVIEAVGDTIYTTTPSTQNPSDQTSIFFGFNSGYGTQNNNVYKIIGLGTRTAFQSGNINNCILLGAETGQALQNSADTIAIGQNAAYQANNLSQSICIGKDAGYDNDNSENAVFIGIRAGRNSLLNNQSIFIGNQAGENSDGSSSSIYIGVQAGLNSSAANTICLGPAAGIANQLNSMTIFSNSSLPAYANRAAALAAITIPNGAVANNTYFYYNQTTFAIEGVRL
jgi:hypothetical protein